MADCVRGNTEIEAANEVLTKFASVELFSLTLNYRVKGLLLRCVEIKIKQVVCRFDELLLNASLDVKRPLTLIKDQSLYLNGVFDDRFIRRISFWIIILSVIDHQQGYLVNHLIDLFIIFASCFIVTSINFDL